MMRLENVKHENWTGEESTVLVALDNSFEFNGDTFRVRLNHEGSNSYGGLNFFRIAHNEGNGYRELDHYDEDLCQFTDLFWTEQEGIEGAIRAAVVYIANHF